MSALYCAESKLEDSLRNHIIKIQDEKERNDYCYGIINGFIDLQYRHIKHDIGGIDDDLRVLDQSHS